MGEAIPFNTPGLPPKPKPTEPQGKRNRHPPPPHPEPETPRKGNPPFMKCTECESTHHHTGIAKTIPNVFCHGCRWVQEEYNLFCNTPDHLKSIKDIKFYSWRPNPPYDEDDEEMDDPCLPLLGSRLRRQKTREPPPRLRPQGKRRGGARKGRTRRPHQSHHHHHHEHSGPATTPPTQRNNSPRWETKRRNLRERSALPRAQVQKTKGYNLEDSYFVSARPKLFVLFRGIRCDIPFFMCDFS
jgi:hypothetical protein